MNGMSLKLSIVFAGIMVVVAIFSVSLLMRHERYLEICETRYLLRFLSHSSAFDTVLEVLLRKITLSEVLNIIGYQGFVKSGSVIVSYIV